MRYPMTAPRAINVALGVWLFISAFVWPHSAGQYTNTWIVGALCTAFAFVALWVQEVRYLNTALAVWLFISAWAIPRISMATLWNNVLVAVAIFAVSLMPSMPPIRRTTAGEPPP